MRIHWAIPRPRGVGVRQVWTGFLNLFGAVEPVAWCAPGAKVWFWRTSEDPARVTCRVCLGELGRRGLVSTNPPMPLFDPLGRSQPRGEAPGDPG